MSLGYLWRYKQGSLTRDLKLALAVLLIACVAGGISVGVLYCFAMVAEPREFLQATRRAGIQLASRGGSPNLPSSFSLTPIGFYEQVVQRVYVKSKLLALQNPHRCEHSFICPLCFVVFVLWSLS